MRIAFVILLVSLTCFSSLEALGWPVNDSLQAVDVNYQFVDGVYTSIEALKTNVPSFSLANISGSLVLQEEEYLLKVEELYPRGRADLLLELQKFKVICVNGLPYVQAFVEEERNYTVYAGLRVRGRLCYYSYEQNYRDTVLIRAYNPVTGRPFRQQNIVRDQAQLHEKVMDLSTGIVYDFNLENMLTLLASDKPLVGSLIKLSPAEAYARLQKCLLIFDDRHPFYLPVPPQKEQP
jgi:hypothetical protein